MKREGRREGGSRKSKGGRREGSGRKERRKERRERKGIWIKFMLCARQFPCSEDRLMGRDCGKVEMKEAHDHFVSRKGWTRL